MRLICKAQYILFLIQISFCADSSYSQSVNPTPVPQKIIPNRVPVKSEEELVDLNNLEPPKPTATKESKKKASADPQPNEGRADTSPIRFKVFFDLNLYRRPGITDLAFDNFHSFLFIEAEPAKNMQFSFDVSPSPRFYELDWQVNPKIQFRAGKIWIPYDDTPNHNIYGGRVSVSRLQLGAAFLPDTWTDLGVGVKWTIADIKNLNLIGDAYVVNGFRSGGTDPLTSGAPYPSFSDISTGADNNTEKAFGGRVHGRFWSRLGLGASFYSGRWSDQGQKQYKVLMYETDAQYKIPQTLSEFRVGIMSMRVQIPIGTIYRAGTYGEYGQYLTRQRTWKLLFRGGTLQMDDRVLDVNDQRIIGGAIIWRPNILQFSLEHSVDTQKVKGKNNYSFTNLRMVISF